MHILLNKRILISNKSEYCAQLLTPCLNKVNLYASNADDIKYSHKAARLEKESLSYYSFSIPSPSRLTKLLSLRLSC